MTTLRKLIVFNALFLFGKNRHRLELSTEILSKIQTIYIIPNVIMQILTALVCQ